MSITPTGGRPLPTPAHLEISAEIAGLLGPDALAQLRDTIAFTSYTCPICDSYGTLDDPSDSAALVAWRYLPVDVTHIRYAHASCSPSAFLTVNAYPALSSHSTAQACCALSKDHRPPAALVIGWAGRLTERTETREPADRYTTALLQRGLALLTSCCQPIPPVDGLAVLIDGDHVHATAPGGQTLFDGILACPPSWLAAARSGGQVAVITAAGLDLSRTAASPPRAQDTRLGAIQHAISTGHAVVGLAPITITQCTLGERRAE
jgi:hypothetical protein